MNERDLDAVFENALRAELSLRCKRAYRHDMRNGLQGIYGGVDALIRATRANQPARISPDQVAQFVRQAITNHEEGLERVLEGIAPDAGEPAVVDIGALLSDLVRFLMNDAARNSVRLRVEAASQMLIRAVPSRLRLAMLGLLVDVIDGLPNGGEALVHVQRIDAGIEVHMTDPRQPSAGAETFAIDLQSKPVWRGIVMHVVRRILATQDARIECDASDAGRQTRIFFKDAG